MVSIRFCFIILFSLSISACQKGGSDSSTTGSSSQGLGIAGTQNGDFNFANYPGLGAMGGIEVSTTPTGGGQEPAPSIVSFNSTTAADMFFRFPDGLKSGTHSNLVSWLEEMLMIVSQENKAVPKVAPLSNGSSLFAPEAFFGLGESKMPGYFCCQAFSHANTAIWPIAVGSYGSCVIRKFAAPTAQSLVARVVGEPFSAQSFAASVAERRFVVDYTNKPTMPTFPTSTGRPAETNQLPDRLVLVVNAASPNHYKAKLTSCWKDSFGNFKAFHQERILFDSAAKELSVDTDEGYSWGTQMTPQLQRSSMVRATAKMNSDFSIDFNEPRAFDVQVSDDDMRYLQGANKSKPVNVLASMVMMPNFSAILKSHAKVAEEDSPLGNLLNMQPSGYNFWASLGVSATTGKEVKLVAKMSLENQANQLRAKKIDSFIERKAHNGTVQVSNSSFFNGESYQLIAQQVTKAVKGNDVDSEAEKQISDAADFFLKPLEKVTVKISSSECEVASAEGVYKVNLASAGAGAIVQACLGARATMSPINFCDGADGYTPLMGTYLNSVPEKMADESPYPLAF